MIALTYYILSVIMESQQSKYQIYQEKKVIEGNIEKGLVQSVQSEQFIQQLASSFRHKANSADGNTQQKQVKLKLFLPHPSFSFKQIDSLSTQKNQLIRSTSSNNMTIELKVSRYGSHPQDKQHDKYQQKSFISDGRFSRGLSLVQENNQFLQSIQFSSVQRWLLLIISAFCNAVVPCWMTVDINCEGITRSAWRIFTLSILLLPFVMCEQRSAKKQEKLKNILNREYLQKIFIGSINYCVWVLFGVLATKITARSHSFCFLRLKFFFITLRKIYLQKQCHQGEIGGSILAGIGMVMMVWDSFHLPVLSVPNIYYLQCYWWQRMLGDLLAVAGCIVLMWLENKYELPNGPRFTTLFLYNIFISVNLVAFGYFFGGNQFSFDHKMGVFGLFTSQNFVGVFYVSIMLGLNLIIANVLVNQIFSQLIRNVASCFQIVITTAVYHIFQIEQIYSGTTCLGLCFIVPGMMMIVGGQGTLDKLEVRINSQIYQSQINTTLMKKNTFILRPVFSQGQNISSQDNLNPIQQEQFSKQESDLISVQKKQKTE